MKGRKKIWLYAIFGTLSVMLLVGAIVFVQSRPPKQPDELLVGDYSYAIAQLEYSIKQTMRKDDLPSVVVAMVTHEDVIYSNAFGYANLDTKQPATLDTIYKMGSISKALVGLEVMRLYEDGLIDIDASITTYLPEFSILFPTDDTRYPTIRELLNHRSGLPRNDNYLPWYWEASPTVLKNVSLSVHDSYLAFRPGERYKYSNLAYNVLGWLIEEMRSDATSAVGLTGGFPYYMKEHLLDPIGMTSSSYGSSMLLHGTEPSNPVAMGYYKEDGDVVPHSQYDMIIMGSSLLQSTMDDMIAFTQFMLGDTSPIIERDTLEMMFEPQSDNPYDPKPNGLGWLAETEMLNQPVIFHDGTNQGTISMMAFLPEEELGLIIYSNSDEFQNSKVQITFETLQNMIEAKHGEFLEEPPQPSYIDVPVETLQSYEGRYVCNDEIYNINVKRGSLTTKYGWFNIKMKPVSDNEFVIDHWLLDFPVKASFYYDSNVEEDILIINIGDTIICPKIPFDSTPTAWDAFIGTYDIQARYPSTYSDSNEFGTMTISREEGYLITSNKTVMIPISETELRILGGVFDGEIMIFDEQNKTIIWQDYIYTRQ